MKYELIINVLQFEVAQISLSIECIFINIMVINKGIACECCKLYDTINQVILKIK